MTTVTLQEARDRLPELLALVAAGEQVVIAEDGKWVAELSAPPPKPPTPEEDAETAARGRDAVRAMVQAWVNEGRPIPAGDPLLQLLRDVA